ncbi:MAG: ATP-binding cassette domain-containing protein [Syntrophorhabdaceae bacterium]|nr:ATP-binding cassette domain-containing protein [Syntrophorhabdaceae bacterium]MDD4197313.1 ATP-binding cassette domain-containing protein [Syntrophorhabdaceae bacterium]HOC45242.1 ATP-binding cassette domain-containing protein [Syntrophorhabdaceae bacterium]
METETPLIEFRNVTKRFNGKTVLDNINLSIYENQVTTIIGKSGTGKSVLLKHIIGLLRPDEGTILFQGKPVNEMKRAEWEGHRKEIAFLFQNNALFDSMTVFDNVAFPLRQTTKLSKSEIEKRAMKRIEDLELGEAIGKFPSELSGGMQKRVALARALVTDPRIVLFDEPTTGQDPIRKNMILSMIIHYRKKFGFTAVMISHDIPDVFFISDRVIILWEGSVGFQGPYEEALRLKVPMIEEFLRSLDGFEDELTGLLSREAFKMHYVALLGNTSMEKTSAALLSVRLNILQEAIGAQASLEFLKALGQYTNQYFNNIGGFSARHSRDEILTIFPRTDLGEARKLVRDFSKKLENGVIERIKDVVLAGSGAETCFDIYMHAGITEVSPDDSIEQIIEKGRARQEIISKHRCDFGGKE